MKRRHFLHLSPALAGLIPAFSDARPCPPGILSVNGGTSTTTVCPSVAPAWFTAMPATTWVEVAGGSGFGATYQNGATIRTVSPDPLAYPNAQGAEGVAAVMDDWTGGCTYQAGAQYLIPCQGGHNGYYGNEIYSLALRANVPSWQRIWGPTADAQIMRTEYGYNAPYAGYADGAPRTSHGWFSNLCTTSGRVLITFSDACPTGEWTTECYSMDVKNTAAGWTFHGRLWQTLPGTPGSGFLYQNGPGAYDKTNNRFYRAAEGSVAKGVVGVSVDAMLAAGPQSKITGPQVPGSSFHDFFFNGIGGGWSAILDDMTPRCWVVASIINNEVWIMDLTNPNAGFTRRTTAGTANGFLPGLGAVYHKPSRAILVGGHERGNTLNKLSITGTNPLTATYTWSAVTIGGPTPRASVNQRGTWNKWQMIEDMGNGQSAIVMATNVDYPTYVLKLPTSGV